MPISQDQLTSLSKQVFILDYLLNGLFPCQSDVVRLIRSKKRDWKFNDKFEYRMLLANTNTGGTLNSQVYQPNVSLNKPGELEYGTFHATYGTITDGFNVDMMINLETKDKKAAFENDFATRMHSLRTNVAALFKNFAIHGKFGVVHQLRASIGAPTLSAGYNPQPNVFTPGNPIIDPDNPGGVRMPFTIKVPINVFNSNFKRGKYLIKTTEPRPDGKAFTDELYMVLENQPGFLTLLAVGTYVTPWKDGEFLEVAQNREVSVNNNIFAPERWNTNSIVVQDGNPFAGKYDCLRQNDAGSKEYTSHENAIVGAMEGMADLFPWYTNPAEPDTRLGMDLPFRGQPNRLRYSTEQGGGWVTQQPGEHIIDAIMRGSFLTKSTVPYADIGIWLNPVTRIAMGYEEGGVTVIRDNMVAGPIVYQRGVKTTDYQFGNQVVKEVVEDMNLPTDVIIIGPKNDLSYNTWDNSMFEIDKYIQETWGKSKMPEIKDISIPNEFVAKLDLSQRITYGSPTLTDGVQAQGFAGSYFRHPKNVVPIALHEMGALFTEYPYTYTIVKLREPICDLVIN